MGPEDGSEVNRVEAFPKLYLARHGETAWSLSGQHTGRADIPLTEKGERNARSLGARLKGLSFVKVFASPLQRATRTSELAGFGTVAIIDPDLMEWNYGQYEGKRTVEIRQERPNWNLFRDGCPAGETLDDISARADRVIGRVRACAGDVLLFAHRDILRILAVRWVGLPGIDAQHFLLTTASLSILGYDHGLDQPVICLWNDDRHLAGDDVRPR
jgi:broad specificity phosphatase PhoE